MLGVRVMDKDKETTFRIKMLKAPTTTSRLFSH